MVVFTCNNCGDSLQKPKVAKHYQFQCRNSISLTCVDCFKDFLGDDYIAHTKCITEAERYGSKDYVAKPSANKGEKKQLEWIKIVNNVINTAKNLSRDEKNILECISKYENVPRKKVKFINFIKNSIGCKVDMRAVENCWNKIETESIDMASAKKTNISKENNGGDIVIKNSEDLNIKKNEEITNSLNDNETKGNNDLSLNGQQISNDKIKDKEKIKFDWRSCILRILGTRNEITLKKLEKKVVAKRLRHSNKISHEKAVARFHKKMSKIPEITLNNDTVKLKYI